MTQRLFKLSALAASLGLASTAHAVVDLNNADAAANGSLSYASELTVTAAGKTLADNGAVFAGAQDLKSTLGFSVNAGAVRFVRLDLSNGAKFTAAPDLRVTDGTETATGSLSQGGAGESFAIYEFTAPTTTGFTGFSPSDSVEVDMKNVDVVSQSDVTATYRLYETGTAATNPSTSSALASASQVAYRFSKALQTTVNDANEKTIDVATNSTKFVGNSTQTNIANVTVGVGTALWDDSQVATLADLVAAGTKLVVTGDFSAVALLNGNPDPAQVTLDVDGAGTATPVAANTLTSSQAEFIIDTTALTTGTVSMTVTGNDEIVDGPYNGVYDVVAAADSSVADVTLGELSKLQKNGSTATANMMLNPNGVFKNWIRISNNSSISGRVFLRLRNDEGKSVAFDLGDVSGQASTTLAAGNATGLISIQSLFDAAKAKDATFDVGAGGRNKLRLTVEGEFPAGTNNDGLVLDNITLSTDNTSFSTFQ